MKAIVCLKEVPETPDGVRVAEEGYLAPRGDAAYLVDPIGPYALETALQLRDRSGGEVIALCVGRPGAAKILKESALAVGADDAFLLADDALVGGDPVAVARALAAAVRKIDGADLIVCGDRAADDNAATVGAALAGLLGIPVLSYVDEILEFDAGEKKIRVGRALEAGREIVEASLPVVLTVMKGIYFPRYASPLGIRKAARREIPVWTVADLGENPSRLGVAGSQTFVRGIESPPPPSGVEMIGGEPEEAVAVLVRKILDAKVL
ncbi:MAG: electron transfer flavoprotein subunit beta/FixA family protein [Candidatus Eisenbacteria bacterium]|nr:electron transfer flavoprotein subunit beta/FixA family protein [Candidatus Eisenbacteria bacterium]